MGCLATVALALTLWAGAVAPAYQVPVELYVDSSSSIEDKPVVFALVKSMQKVVESSKILKVVEPDILSPPETVELHLAISVGEDKIITSWEVWIMDDRMRRQQIWRSGLSWVEVDSETQVWRGNALVTKQTIRVVQALEQLELSRIEAIKKVTQGSTKDL